MDNPLSQVTTPAKIEADYNLSAGTVRQYLKRHAEDMIKRNVLVKIDNRTWLMLKSEAETIWGKKAN
jgi:hypothetical protein